MDTRGLIEVSRRTFRRGVAAFVAASILLACQSPIDKEGFDALSRDRVKTGLPAFKYSNMLQDKADRWADHIAQTDVLEHSTLTDGISGCWLTIGENVGYGPSVEAVETAYMNSPSHKANIVNPKFDDAAVAAVKDGSRVYTVQLFLNRC